MLGTEQSSVRAGWSCFINFKDRQLAPTCHPSVRFGPLLSREPVTWLTVRRPCLQDAVLTDPHFIAPFSFQIHWGPTGKTGGFLEWRQRPSGCQTVISGPGWLCPSLVRGHLCVWRWAQTWEGLAFTPASLGVAEQTALTPQPLPIPLPSHSPLSEGSSCVAVCTSAIWSQTS